MSYTKGNRYGVVPGVNNQYSVNHKEIQAIPFAATQNIAALSGDSEEILLDFALITGAMTINMDVAAPFNGDKLTMMLPSDATGRTVTFGTGFIDTAATIVLTSNAVGVVEFIFNGVVGKWVEKSRAIN